MRRAVTAPRAQTLLSPAALALRAYAAAVSHILKYLYPRPPLGDQVSMTYNNLKPIYRDKINRRLVRKFRDLELFGKEFEAAS